MYYWRGNHTPSLASSLFLHVLPSSSLCNAGLSWALTAHCTCPHHCSYFPQLIKAAHTHTHYGMSVSIGKRQREAEMWKVIYGSWLNMWAREAANQWTGEKMTRNANVCVRVYVLVFDEGVLVDGLDDIFEEDLRRERVAVVDDGLTVLTVPAIHCGQETGRWS